MTSRASFTSVLVECYSVVGERLEQVIKRSENTENSSLWEMLFIAQLLLLAAFVIATPVIFAWAAVRWYKSPPVGEE